MKEKNLGLSQQEFEQLVAQASPYNEVAFERLYKKIFHANYKYLENWLRKEVGNHSSIDIEDCVQEAFIRLSEAIENNKLTYGNLSGWLKTVVKHIWLAEKRQQQVSVESTSILEQIPDNILLMEDLELERIQNSAYHHAYSTMPKILQDVFNLHIISAVSHQKIANLLNISEDVSRDRVRRAKEYLKSKIILNPLLSIAIKTFVAIYLNV